MELEVEETELQLAQHRHGGLEVLRPFKAVDHDIREDFARLVMFGEKFQYLRFVGKVLQELGREFHCVPLYTVDPADAVFVDGAEQVVQGVAHFVEEGDDVVVA